MSIFSFSHKMFKIDYIFGKFWTVFRAFYKMLHYMSYKSTQMFHKSFRKGLCKLSLLCDSCFTQFPLTMKHLYANYSRSKVTILQQQKKIFPLWYPCHWSILIAQLVIDTKLCSKGPILYPSLTIIINQLVWMTALPLSLNSVQRKHILNLSLIQMLSDAPGADGVLKT